MSTPASIGIKAAKLVAIGSPPSRPLSNGAFRHTTCLHRYGSTATCHIVTSYSFIPRGLAQSHGTTAARKHMHGPDEDRTARPIKPYVACRNTNRYNSECGLHRTKYLIETIASGTPNDNHVTSKYVNGFITDL